MTKYLTSGVFSIIVLTSLIIANGARGQGNNLLLYPGTESNSRLLVNTPDETTLFSKPERQSFSTYESHNASDLIGSWDITLTIEGKEAPSWLEVKLSGSRTLVGHFVGNDGSARPISRILFEEGNFGFSIPPQWQSEDADLILEGKLEGSKISGTITYPNQKTYPFSGEKAPSLVREKAPKWENPISLFNGKDLTGWYADKERNQWVVSNGVLTSTRSGANLISDQKFEDLKLVVEFRYPSGSNSGIYLRGRYEVQIEDSPTDYPSSVHFGGIYGFLTPNEMVKKSPGEWQRFEIELIGRRVTIVANGTTIICDQIIPGITGGALDSKEGLAGPIMIQGDHGPIEIRKIELTPAIYQ